MNYSNEKIARLYAKYKVLMVTGDNKKLNSDYVSNYNYNYIYIITDRVIKVRTLNDVYWSPDMDKYDTGVENGIILEIPTIRYV